MHFDNVVNLGSILSLVVYIATLGWAWGSLRTSMGDVTRRVTEMEDELKAEGSFVPRRECVIIEGAVSKRLELMGTHIERYQAEATAVRERLARIEQLLVDIKKANGGGR